VAAVCLSAADEKSGVNVALHDGVRVQCEESPRVGARIEQLRGVGERHALATVDGTLDQPAARRQRSSLRWAEQRAPVGPVAELSPHVGLRQQPAAAAAAAAVPVPIRMAPGQQQQNSGGPGGLDGLHELHLVCDRVDPPAPRDTLVRAEPPAAPVRRTTRVPVWRNDHVWQRRAARAAQKCVGDTL